MAQKEAGDLALLPAHKLAKLFRRGEASPVEDTTAPAASTCTAT